MSERRLVINNHFRLQVAPRLFQFSRNSETFNRPRWSTPFQLRMRLQWRSWLLLSRLFVPRRNSRISSSWFDESQTYLSLQAIHIQCTRVDWLCYRMWTETINNTQTVGHAHTSFSTQVLSVGLIYLFYSLSYLLAIMMYYVTIMLAMLRPKQWLIV